MLFTRVWLYCTSSEKRNAMALRLTCSCKSDKKVSKEARAETDTAERRAALFA